MMARDVLFLLEPLFHDNGRKEYCPECAEIWGVLSYFPDIKTRLDIRYQPIEKPRTELQSLLGSENQNCPTLVLSETSQNVEHSGIVSANGVRFIDNARGIGQYFAQRFGTPFPRGG